jgi:probable HAF family extracellular repeat protein
MPRRLTFSAVVIFAFSALASGQSYTVTDLGVLSGDSGTLGYGVNALGGAVGVSQPSQTAFRWTERRGIKKLESLPGFHGSTAYKVNISGEAVGQAMAGDGSGHAILWTKAGRMRDLGIPKGFRYSTAYAINDLGHVAGWGERAFLWTRREGFRDLGTLPGGPSSVSWGINLYDHIIGFSDCHHCASHHPFFWTKEDGMRDLGLLEGGSIGEALSINNFDDVVGLADSDKHHGVSNVHAILWQERGEDKRDLGTLPGGNQSLALGINDLGKVVGQANVTHDGYTTHAFVWSERNGMQDLNSLIAANSGWVLNVASFISVRGQIVGWGTINGQIHGFLLTRDTP